MAAGLAVAAAALWLMAQPVGDPLIEGLRNVEVASVADAIEQLYGERGICRTRCGRWRRRNSPVRQ